MSALNLDVLKEDFSLLIEAGFVAVKQLDETSAVRIFQAAKTISPGNTAPDIGLGYIALNKLEIKESIRIFEEVLKVESENDLAKAFLGMSLMLDPKRHEEGKKWVEKARAHAEDPTIVSLCEIAAEWGEKDLRKMKNPFFEKKPSSEEK